MTFTRLAAVCCLTGELDRAIALSEECLRISEELGEQWCRGTALWTRGAELVTRGLGNREIAEQLVLAKRTVDSHIEHIFSKLGFTSRTQLAAWVSRQNAH